MANCDCEVMAAYIAELEKENVELIRMIETAQIICQQLHGPAQKAMNKGDLPRAAYGYHKGTAESLEAVLSALGTRPSTLPPPKNIFDFAWRQFKELTQ